MSLVRRVLFDVAACGLIRCTDMELEDGSATMSQFIGEKKQFLSYVRVTAGAFAGSVLAGLSRTDLQEQSELSPMP